MAPPIVLRNFTEGDRRDTEMAFIKDNDLTETGLATYALAKEAEEELKKELKDPKEEKYRIRCRLRSRTGMWDVVVKVKREEKAA
jgi:hypothetical protein